MKTMRNSTVAIGTARAAIRTMKADGKETPTREYLGSLWHELSSVTDFASQSFGTMLDRVLAILDIARELGEPGLETAALSYASHVCQRCGKDREMEEYFRECVALFPLVDRPEERMRIANFLAMEYVRRDDVNMGIPLLREAEDLAHRLGAHDRLVGIYQTMSIAFFKMGVFEEALEYNLRSIRLFEEGPAANQHTRAGSTIIMILTNIGAVYGQLHDYPKGVEFTLRALDISRASNRVELTASILLNLGTMYVKLGRYQEAIASLQEGLEIFLAHDSYTSCAEVLAELGLASLHSGDLDTAQGHFERAWEMVERAHIEMITPAVILRGRGQVHQRRGEIAAARDFYLRALEICERFGQPDEIMQVHALLAEVYPLLNDFRRGYEHLKKASDLRDQLVGDERHRAAAAVELRNARIEAEQVRENLQRRAEQAEREMEFKTKELSGMVLQLTHRNEALRAIQQMAQPYVRDGRGQTKALASAILQSIASVVETRDDWKMFEEQFERVHSEFITRLGERCPKLSSTEIRICVLIRLNLSTKQIADALFSSELTIKKHRANIRKKLALSRDENLSGLLLSL